MLDTKERQILRARAHALKPVVMIGAHGVTDGVVAELEVALNAHELIKVRLPSVPHDQRDAMTQTLAETSHADIIGRVGRMLILYRPRPESARKR
ncbi:MAG: YhbY family RNA-binding protein [Acidithiobacillus sp.]|nr:YhbY family RNA-binding protein [Acidithiobacillus sp.]